MHAPSVARADLTQSIEKDFAILVLLKNRFPTITTAHQMIKCSLKFHSRHSRHRPTLHLYSSYDKNKDMTPISYPYLLPVIIPGGSSVTVKSLAFLKMSCTAATPVLPLDRCSTLKAGN